MDDGVGADGFAEDVGEEAGTKEAGDAAQAVDGALELALFGGADFMRHDALCGRPYQRHEVKDGDGQPEEQAGLRESEQGVAQRAADEADGDGSALS
jgi:hypothetical protein